MTLEQIARTAHDVNHAYCEAVGLPSVPWNEAPDEVRESLLAGVMQIIQAPDTTPEQSHASWYAKKAAAGWTWGPVKDAELKEHPCFVDYAKLPSEQRVKDYLFGAVVRSLLALREELTPRILGPTGEFPRGALNPQDEGATQIGVSVDQGTVILAFGKPTAWLGLPPAVAVAFAHAVLKKAAAAALVS